MKMIDERLKFPDVPTVAFVHAFPNERVQPLYDNIVWQIIEPAGKDEIDISDALVALSAAVLTTLAMAPEKYREQLRAKVVLRIGSGDGVRDIMDIAAEQAKQTK
jgi:hypothetical protein